MSQRCGWSGAFARALKLCAVLLLGALGSAAAQQPAPGAACVVTAGNRNAPLAADGAYTVFGIPGNAGAIRARVSCSDGSVGQSAIGFTDPNQAVVVELGPIVFGRLDPVPLAVELSASSPRLGAGESAQMTLMAVGADGSVRDVTSRSEGTTYSVSNELLASVGENGAIQIYPAFASGSSARVVAGAVAEGAAAASFMFTLGPRGRLEGRVVRADGSTPVPTAQVAVMRLQPAEQAGLALTGSDGRFAIDEVNAGTFLVSAIDPATGDRALAIGRIENEGETETVELRLGGQGTVDVIVRDALDQNVSGAAVTYTALGAFRTSRTLETSADGSVRFASMPSGDFTVSTRDPATRLIGTAVGRIEVGETRQVILRLQPIGALAGRVLDVDGTSPVAGVQVRLLSRERGILTQVTTQADGAFAFDTLPIGDGPYTLDAFVGGRLRARLPGIVFSTPDEAIVRDIVFGPVGEVTGQVRTGSGTPLPGSSVVLQSIEGLRLRFDVTTDSEGRYRVPAVPVGDFELTATSQAGRIGRAAGRMNSDGQVVQRDVIVVEDTLVGTVFQRDRVTPVGANVAVYLAPRSAGLHYSLDGHPQAIQTRTDAQGRFGFTVPRADVFVVQAEDGLERARTQAVVVNLNPSQPLVADMSYLAKGTVSGQVTDSSGQPQSGASVTVRSEGAFVADRTTQSDASGRYSMVGVFAGDVAVTAVNTATQLSGVARGRLDAEGQQIEIDVMLAATGTIEGQILRRDGTVVPGAARIELRRQGSRLLQLEFASGSQYRFEFVPLGDIELIAEEIATGDKGSATTRVSAAGELKVVPVRLVGQADVLVTLQTEGGDPVEGARVVASQSTPFALSSELISNAQGQVHFVPMFAGDFSISATKPAPFGQLSGAASGTLLPGVGQQLTISMTARAFGRIEGTVFAPDGTTPAGAGKIVRMLPEPFPNAFVAQTDGQGRYAFEPVDAGTYTVDVLSFFAPGSGACPDRDRIRGRATGVNLATQGQVVAADVQLIGSGAVTGTVVDAQGAPVGGVEIRLTNPDPVYGANVTCGGRTTYDTTTDANGQYLLPDVPPGDFSLTASNAARTLRAEAIGRVRFDGDIVTLDLEVVDSAVTMPYVFHDANGFRVDVQGNGAIGTGTNNVFGSPAPDNAGMRLEIVRDGIAVPFTNGDGTIGRLDERGEAIEVDDVTPFGLVVTRRIFTPRAGYFARYLEVLENPGTDPVTVDVRIRSHHRQSNSNPRVVDTSDGDQVLSVLDLASPDRWVVIDDQADEDPFSGGSIPATGHLFDGVGAAARVAAAGYELIGNTGRLTYRWNGITVPAGGRVILMHFAFHQIDREAAREAAERLLHLPPEAIDDLTTDERAAIFNFALPEQSLLEPLPNLDAGIVEGRVLSGDGETPVAGASVRFKSRHPLFGRVRTQNTGADGGFRFRSTLNGSVSNYVIPVSAFELSATYSRSGAGSSLAQGDFEPGTTTEVQDIVFATTGNVRGMVLRHGGAPVDSASVDLCTQPSRGTCTLVSPNPANFTVSGVDGSYLMVANSPRDYWLFARKSHPQTVPGGGARPIYGEAQTTITAGDTVVANVVLEPTGSISGIVRAADGTPVVGASIELWLGTNGSGGRARGTSTDTSGRYRLFDLPLGPHEVRARDVSSGAEGKASATVAVDIESVADITLGGFGALRVQVEFARGAPAGNAFVSVDGISQQFADSNGQALFQTPEGVYTVRARHPDYDDPRLRAAVSATVSAPGQQVDVLVMLAPAGAVSGTIVRPDGTTLAGGFPYSIRQIRGSGADLRSGSTSQTGAYRIAGLPLGGYVITAFDAAQDRFADAEFDVTEDGQEVDVDLVLLENRIALPATLRDANRFAFDVQHSGALATGSSAFSNAGAMLEINGQPYIGQTSARLESARRQFAIAQPQAIDGLLVTRRIYVPRGAYFARFVETLENPGATPVTASVRISTQFSAGTVRATSSGDTVVGADDRWVMVDDAVDEDILLALQETPAAAHVFAGPAGTAPDSVVLDYPTDRPRLRVTWQTLEVPAGGSVNLVHFVVQQVRRSGALAAVERLEQLPPEAIAEPPEPLASGAINFVLPADGISLVEPLPPLTGSIGGVAYEGDERTPVRTARVTVQSSHPLFSRMWGKQRDPFGICPPGTPAASLVSLAVSPGGVTNPPPPGSWSLQGQLTADDSIALPEGWPARISAQEATSCFGYHAGHPFTRVPSRIETTTPSNILPLIWDTGILTGTVVGAQDFSITSGRLYRSIDDPDPAYPVYVPIAADATWVYPGLPPGRYDLLFDTSHPQGVGSTGGRLRGQRLSVDVTLGQITVTDVSMQPTGALQGTVLTALGEASRDARILLDGAAAGQSYDQCATGCDPATLAKHKGRRAVSREVRTDSLGRYAFAAVPEGEYTLTAIDPVSQARSSTSVSVTRDASAVQNVVLRPLGSVQIEVRRVGGAPAVDALTYLDAEHVGFEQVVGRTDGAGRLTIASVPTGNYAVRVRDPRYPNTEFMSRSATGSIETGGEADSHVLTLRTAAILQITTIDGDNGSVPVSGAMVWIRDANGERRVADTDASGRSTAAPVVDGSWTVRVRATLNGALKEELATGTLSSSDDGLTLPVTIDLRSSVVALPHTLYDANRQAYTIQPDGSGTRLPRLSVDGVAFTGTSPVPRQLGGRQHSIEQAATLSGLTVTRRVHVPRNGYYVRHVEVIENRTASAIVADLEIESLQPSDWNVRATSSGDTVIDTDGVNPDRWFVLGPNQAASSHWAMVASAASGTLPAPELSHAGPNGFNDRAARASWNDVTVPAGGRVVLLHFSSRQLTRDAAIASAERLSQLPPEAIEGLFAEDIDAAANFEVPVDGSSPLAPLPSLDGRVSGRLLEGDGLTPVVSTYVFIRSLHPLFPREWFHPSLYTDASGNFLLQGTVREDSETIALPVDSDVALRAVHPQTSLAASALASFPSEQSALQQDLIFSSATIEGTVSGAYQSSLIGGSVEALVGTTVIANSSLDSNARFRLGGLGSGSYRLRAQYWVAGGTPLVGEVVDVPAIAGQTRTQDIVLNPNGTLTGRVFDASGAPRVNATVQLRHASSGYQRNSSTNASGRYTITAIPVEDYSVTAIDPITSARAQVAVAINDQATTERDIHFVGRGQVTATLRFARGDVLPGRHIVLTSPDIVGSVSHGPTDGGGQRVIPISVGPYTLSSTHPQTGETGEVNGSITSDGETAAIDLHLPASAVLRVRVVDAEQGNAPIAGVQVRYTAATGNTVTQFSPATDSNGWTQLPPLRQTTYALLAFAPDGRRVQGNFSVDAAVDGQTVETTLAVQPGDETEGEFTWGQARHPYSIEAQPGDVIALSIRATANCDVRVEVFNPARSRIALGYGRGPAWSYTQVNESGDLRNIVAATAGNHSVAVYPRTPSCFATGYRLAATVNGEPRSLLAYQGGGSVEGRVFLPDGATPLADARIRLSVSTNPQAGLEILSDAFGYYRFEHVPLGSYHLRYIPPAGSQRSAELYDYLGLPGEVDQRDLVLNADTTVNVRVLFGDGQPVGSGVNVVMVAPGFYASLYTDSDSRVTRQYVGNATLSVRAYHPSISGLFFDVPVEPLDQGLREVEVRLATADVGGFVRDPDGVAVANAMVQVEFPHNGQWVRSEQTNAQGRFDIEDIPAGVDMRLVAADPRNQVRSGLSINATPDSALERDVVLVGRGTIEGRVVTTDGTPLSFVDIYANYRRDIDPDTETNVYAQADNDGEYRFDNLPVQRPVRMLASIYLGGQNYDSEVTLEIAEHGDTLTHDIVFDLPGGHLEVLVQGVDGLPAEGDCELNLQFMGGGERVAAGKGFGGGDQWLYEPCSSDLRFNALPPGPYLLSGYNDGRELEEREIEIVDEQTATEIYEFTVVHGVVRYHDNQNVAQAYVEIADQSGNSYWDESDESGNYRVLGPQSGALEISAEDGYSGLTRVVQATLLDPETPLNVDLQFDPTALIAGSVIDHDGTPVPDADVFARPQSSGGERVTTTDAQGVFGFDRVPLDQVALNARHPDTGLIAVANATLTVPDEVVSVQLQFPLPGVVRGVVTTAQGQPAAGACVEIRSTEAELGYAEFLASTTAAADGSYRFESMIPGRFHLIAAGCSAGTGHALADGSVESGAEVQHDLVLGSAISTGTQVWSEALSGYDFRIAWPSGIRATRTSGPTQMAFSSAFNLLIGGSEFPYRYALLPRAEGREAEFSSQGFAQGIRATRRLWVSGDAGFARWFDSFTNTGSEPVAVSVSYRGNYGAWGQLLPVAPESTANRYAVQAPLDPAPTWAQGSAGVVFAGSDGVAPAQVSMQPGFDPYNWSWTITLAPGDTRSLLQFAVPRPSDSAADAQAHSEALSQGTVPTMFDGLDAVERAQIINFVVSQ